MKYEIFEKTEPYKFLFWSGIKTYYYVTKKYEVNLPVDRKCVIINTEIYSRDYELVPDFRPYGIYKDTPYKFRTFKNAYNFIEKLKIKDEIKNDDGVSVYDTSSL